ncbi:MAG: hypothetical protein HFJ50_08045 [Clostridia bacterium]|nr:hypothetical protein [Clostridia bacterium]
MDFGASISMIIIACLSVIAAKYNIIEITLLGALICGACLGFLIFNLHPAKIFMGDTGSLLLRRSNSCYGTIFKSTNYTCFSCYNTSFRDNFSYTSSSLF